MHPLTYNRAMVSHAEVNARKLGRDRLSTLLALTLTSAALFRFVELPTFSWGVRRFLGSPLGFTIGGEWLLSLLMMALVATGTFAFLHEGHRTVERRALLLGLIPPTLTALAASLVLAHATSWPLWMGYLVAGGTALGIVLALTDRAVDPEAESYPSSRAMLNLLDLFLAFGLYVAILIAQERALITAPFIFALSFVVALDLLAPTGAQLAVLLRFAFVIALIESETAWVLSFWPITPMIAAAMLTGILYLLSGIAYQELLGKLTRRVLMEFVLFALLFAILVLYLRS